MSITDKEVQDRVQAIIGDVFKYIESVRRADKREIENLKLALSQWKESHESILARCRRRDEELAVSESERAAALESNAELTARVANLEKTIADDRIATKFLRDAVKRHIGEMSQYSYFEIAGGGHTSIERLRDVAGLDPEDRAVSATRTFTVMARSFD